MNIGMKYRVLALGLVLTFLTPAFPAVGTSAGGGTGGAGGADGAGHSGGRAAPDHNMSIDVNLSATSLQNVVLRPGTGITLRGLQDYAVQPSFDVTTGTNKKYNLHAAVNSRGNSFIVWEEKTSSFDVRAACFDSSGAIIGSIIPLAVQNYGEFSPALAVLPDDGFVVVWADGRGTSGYPQIYAQLFDQDGKRSGDDFAATNASYPVDMPAVAPEPDGGFLVAWRSSSMGPVEVQRFDANRQKVGSEITAIPYTDMDMTMEDVELAANLNGSFVVVCAENIYHIPVYIYNLHGQWFDSNGTKVGSEVALIPDNSATGVQASLSTAPYGDFLIAMDNGVARWYDELGQPLGADLALPGYHPRVAVLSDGGYLEADEPAYMAIKGQLYDHGGHALGAQMDLGTDPAVILDYVISVGPNDTFTFAWVTQPGQTEIDIHACRGIRPFLAMGVLETGDLSPADLISWTAVDMNATLPNPVSNSLILSLSTDHGLSWSPLPANGSLASAGNASSIRLKATFGTLDNSTSPILHGLAAGYIRNRPPAVSLPSDINAWTNTPVNITANGSDPDGDPLVYTWTQASGPDLGMNGTTGAILPFTAPTAGIYKLGVRANDGFNDSLPAYIYLMVTDRPNVPTLTVSSPTAGQLVNTTTLTVVFTVKDYTITQTGGHIHYQLDSSGEVMWFSTAPFNLTGLSEGNHTLRVYLADANHTRLPNPESYVTVNFTVGNLPQLPDLSISASDLKLNPSNPKAGDSATISVTVHNTGTADAGIFAVRFLVDGTALPDQNVALLAKGGSTVVEAKWKATSGSHNISVQVNPGGGLPESSSSNNDASVQLSVAKPEAGGASGGAPMLLIGIVVLIIIVVVVLLAVMMMRRKKPTTVVQYQPPAQQAQAASQPPSPPGPNFAPAAPQAQQQVPSPPPPVQGPPVPPMSPPS